MILNIYAKINIYKNVSKSIKIISFYTLLIIFVQSLSSFEPAKDSFNPSLIQLKSNELTYSNIIDITVKSSDNENLIVGFNGILCLKAEYNKSLSYVFELETIEKDTSFTTGYMSLEMLERGIDCRLWMKSDSIYVFCDNYFDRGINSIHIYDGSVYYKYKYHIKIKFKNFITFKQLDIEIPFIYSLKQKINLDESQSFYELKFKIQMYNNEILYINGTGYNYAILDDCKKKSKELICKISKEKIEEILILKNESFTIGAMNDNFGLVIFEFVSQIIIEHEKVIKEDIYIKLEKLVGGITEVNTPFAYETNLTEIPNFISGFIVQGLYFKKMSGKPLMLFFEYPIEVDEVIIEKNPNETIFNNVHYKYNFRVQPYQFNETIRVKNSGTNVLLTHPENIIFNSEDSKVIRYIMTNPSLATDIKLDPNSKYYLECKDINGMKKCNVPESHFTSMKSGYYNTYHKNHEDDFNIYYNAPLFNITFPKADKIRELYIEEEDNKKRKYIGFQGILNFVLDYNDNKTNIFNASDIEDKTNFESTIVVDNADTISVTCKLWKPIDEKLNMFCKLSDNLTYGEHSFKLNSSSFYYYDRKFEIIQKAERLFLFQLNEHLPFLYSGKQTINIEEKIETYDLKFKIGEYHNEHFIITGESLGSIILDECSVNGKELVCKIEKVVIEEFASYNGQKLFVSYSILQSEYIIEMDNSNIYSIYGIYINYPLNKKNINVEITKLVENSVDVNNFITYETNVKDIEKVYTKRFLLNLSNKNKIECSLRKTEGISLVMICLSSKEGEFSLSEIRNQIVLNNINIKYNFIIQPINNNEKWKSSGYGSFIIYGIPKVLDFNLHDPITIDYAIKYSKNSNGIKLNPNTNKLECDDINEAHKRCKVSKSHFRGNKSAYFYTYHDNHDGKSIMYYESSPFKVILPNIIYISINNEDNENIINIGEKGVFALITDYNNKEKILDSNDNISFAGTFVGFLNKYEANCSIWIPNDDNLRIICKLNKSLLFKSESILLDKIETVYKNYTIIIEQNEYIYFQQHLGHIPFLYSDRQEININDDKTSYELKFKIEAYNKDLLFIDGSNNNNAILDYCQSDTKELKCYFTKEKIEEILTSNNEQFKIAAIDDTIGLIPLVHILNITINYKNVQKEDIVIQLTKIVGGITEVGTPFAYETNITEFPNFISQKFDKVFYMKKISGRPLMLFCDNPEETDKSPLKNNSKEIVINNAHYKYIFRIRPHEISDRVSIKGTGAKILLAYPEVLNYTAGETLSIRYILDKQYLMPIKLNPYSKSILECYNLNMMKKCFVPKSHFRERKSGYFNTYHLNHENNYNIYYDSPLFNVFLPKINEIELYIEGGNNIFLQYIGLNGIINIVLDYNDNETNIFDASDLEEQSTFNTTISINIIDEDEKESTNATCKLWKPVDEKLKMFCKLNITFKEGQIGFNISNSSFYYKDIKVNVISKAYHLYFIQLNTTIPFLYSSKQVLDVVEKTDIYKLKYKIGEYNNEILYLSQNHDGLILDKCSIEGKELICKITKTEIEELAVFDENRLDISFYKPNSIIRDIGHQLSYSNGGIYINYTLNKKDIYVNITKLVDSSIDNNNLITYETNISDITNINSNSFQIKLSDENTISCFFKKSEVLPLLMICKLPNNHGDTFSFGEINEQIELKNITIKYNFFISPTKNNEKCNIGGIGGPIWFTFPKALNFTSKDSITIEYLIDNPRNATKIKLNPDGNELECTNHFNKLKRCIVYKNHFENKTSGYYFTYHLNYLAKSIIYYESPPINVILKDVILSFKEENNKNQINLGKNNRVFALISNYNDKERNIFNNNDNINFNAILSDINDYNVQYNANCRLWKPNDDYIRIICNLDDDLKNSTQKLILNRTSFDYKEFKVYIKQDKALRYHQYEHDIPFLYSDKQIININDDNSYELIFESEVFKNNILYIHSSNNNYAILDECTSNEKEVICKITKKKIEEILAINNEQFKIGAIDDNVGIIPFDHILNITINYENVKKEEIYLKIIKTIGGITEKGTSFAWETNITEFPTFTSQIFSDFGYFKKIPGRPLLFIIDYPQDFNYNNNITYPEEQVIDNIHYKYIFKVQPCSFEVNLSISGNGTNILLEYPQKIDFNSSNETSKVIRIIADNPELMKNLKLDLSSKSNLECEDLNMMKKCIVPIYHFKEVKSDYFNIYHLNHENNYNIYYDSPLINVITGDFITLYIENEDNRNTQYIGFNGILNIVLNYIDNETNIFDVSDLEEKSFFETTIIIDNNDKINATCRLWKPINEKLNMFCKFNTSFKTDSHYYKISPSSFYYKDKKVVIISNADNLIFIQINSTLPFLYSSKQILNIDEENNIYELKYKIGEYHNEMLFIKQRYNSIILDKCSIEGKELICKINKTEIEEYVYYNGQRLDISIYTFSFTSDVIEIQLENSNYGIYINYSLNKKDIYIKITNLVDSNIDRNNLITYGTNVEDISNVNSKVFNIDLSIGSKIECFLKKSERTSLIMVCRLDEIYGGSFYLGEIKEQIDLKDINIKYNFFILPVNNTETCIINGEGANLGLIIPRTLDFTLNDTITIDFLLRYIEYSRGMKLNLYGKELECIDRSDVRRCTVHKSHFQNKTSDYYLPYHLNHLNKSIIYYEASPIKVILPESKGTQLNKNLVVIIVGSVLGGFALIFVIISIFICIIKKKRNSGETNVKIENIIKNSRQIELLEDDKSE